MMNDWVSAKPRKRAASPPPAEAPQVLCPGVVAPVGPTTQVQPLPTLVLCGNCRGTGYVQALGITGWSTNTPIGCGGSRFEYTTQRCPTCAGRGWVFPDLAQPWHSRMLTTFPPGRIGYNCLT